MKISKITYLIIYLSLIVFPGSLLAIGGYFIPSLNILAFKTYYIYYGGIVLSLASLVILFVTSKFIKTNFSNKASKIDNNYILKTNLIFIIFYLLINIISLILNHLNIDKYFIYALYVFYPLIYFCLILFLDHEKLNKKNVIYIILSIYLLWYFLVPLLSFIISNKAVINILYLRSLAYNLVYHYLQYSILILPFMTLGLAKLSNEQKDKSVVYKFSFSIKKLFVIAIILSAIALSLALIFKR